MREPSPDTLKLLLDYEVGGGKSYYDKKLSRFTWPKGFSGPTIGIGIDTAYYTTNELANIFDFLPSEQIKLIQGAVGKTGNAGAEYTLKLQKAGIIVPWDKALEIFKELTWTKFSRLAEQAFPGLYQWEDDAYGGIVSLVFNRGTSMTGSSRLEMRNIRRFVPNKSYKEVAAEIRKMKRLWEGKGLDGLLKRREAEARLIEKCI
jgi:hypothetical protein